MRLARREERDAHHRPGNHAVHDGLDLSSLAHLFDQGRSVLVAGLADARRHDLGIDVVHAEALLLGSLLRLQQLLVKLALLGPTLPDAGLANEQCAKRVGE